jgi:hypothetical protein
LITDMEIEIPSPVIYPTCGDLFPFTSQKLPEPSTLSPPSSHSISEPSVSPFPIPASKLTIDCTWASCNKIFNSKSAYDHHWRNHAKPFQCPLRSTRTPTKRQLGRHINDKHTTTERYFCSVSGCKRSKDGKPFPRELNCKRHMKLMHGFSDVECEKDEMTRKIRRDRKTGKRSGS